MTPSTDLTYGQYLRLDDLLSCQQPATEAHDEMLFVIIHQVYELWFKQILHEARLLQDRLEADDPAGTLATARRIATILKTVVGQFDVLETMTPAQFSSFRTALGSSSGLQSAQFRQIEAVLGRRGLVVDADEPLREIVERRPVFDSLLVMLATRGYPVPDDLLHRDPREPWPSGDERVLALLARVYAADELLSGVCEALIDIDQGVQEWRYRHVKMVERVIGNKAGTGGSAGAAFLRGTLFTPSFPDLWTARSE